MKFELIKFHLSLLLLALSEAKYKSLYGGKLARAAGQFPFVVSLTFEKEYSSHHYCGASIIHERWLLTAAHCLFEHDEKNSDITQGTVVKVGFGNYKIEKFYKHPDFVVIPEDENDGLEYIINDIGLIRLTSNLTFNDQVQPITLATEDNDSYENAMVTLPGWGRISYHRRSRNLHYIIVRVLTHEECRRVWTYADKHICTSTQEKQGVCYGDSGSPLIVSDVQIGITSTADTYCQSLKPDLYTKAASFVPWIKSIMSRHGDVLPDS